MAIVTIATRIGDLKLVLLSVGFDGQTRLVTISNY